MICFTFQYEIVSDWLTHFGGPLGIGSALWTCYGECPKNKLINSLFGHSPVNVKICQVYTVNVQKSKLFYRGFFLYVGSYLPVLVLSYCLPIDAISSIFFCSWNIVGLFYQNTSVPKRRWPHVLILMTLQKIQLKG